MGRNIDIDDIDAVARDSVIQASQQRLRFMLIILIAMAFDFGLRHNDIVPSRSSKDHDFTTVARRIVEHLIGGKLSGEPLDDPNAGKNPAVILPASAQDRLIQ